MSVEANRCPVGLRRVVVIDTVLMLLTLAVALHFWPDVISRYFLLLGACVWLFLGPGLLITRPGVWKNARRVAYGYAMMLSLFAFMVVFKGLFLSWVWAVVGALILVVYLIGLRGYLNTMRVREFFQVPAPEPEKTLDSK